MRRDKPASKSMTIQGAIALALFAVAAPLLAKAGVEIDAELKQAIVLILGSIVAVGLRRAQGGLQ